MSIEKYLEHIKVPEVHPCPFSVRLKHNLKRELYQKKRRSDLVYKVTGTVGALALVISIALVYKPTIASNLHNNLLYKTGIVKEEAFDLEQLLAEKKQAELELPYDEGISLGMKHSASQESSIMEEKQIYELSDLPEGNSYTIRKARDKNNREIYLINETSPRRNTSR
jgi:hypothetical protein